MPLLGTLRIHYEGEAVKRESCHDQQVLLTGDTLFLTGVGRPDLQQTPMR